MPEAAPSSAAAPAATSTAQPASQAGQGSNFPTPPPGSSGTPPNGAQKPRNGEANQPSGTKQPPVSVGSTEPTVEDLFEVTIDGRKEKWNRDRVLREAQKSAAAQKRFQESAEQTKKVQQLLAALKDDPEGALAHLGIDVDGLAQQRLLRQFEDSRLTPEQRELKAAQAQIQAMQKQNETQKQAWERQQQEVATTEAAKHLKVQLDKAAELGGLPKTAQTLDGLVAIGIEAAQLGLPLQPEHLVAEFKAREDAKLESWVKQFEGLPDEVMLQRLPPNFLERLMRAGVRMLNAQATNASQPQPPSTPAQPRKSQYITESELRAEELARRRA